MWTCPGCNYCELNYEFTYMSQTGLPLGRPAVLLGEEHRPDMRATEMEPKLQPDRPLCSYTFYYQMHCRAVPIVCMMYVPTITTFKIVKLSSLSYHKFLVYCIIFFYFSVSSFLWLMEKIK